MTFFKAISAKMSVLFCIAMFVVACSESNKTQEPEAASTALMSQTKKVFQEGVHFQTFEFGLEQQVSDQVVEVFWYGCGHCKSFAPVYKKWLDENPNINSRYVPVIWNDKTELHARVFFLLREQENFDELHFKMFEAMTEIAAEASTGKQKIALVKKLVDWGISGEDVVEALESGKYDPNIAASSDLMGQFQVRGVPAVIVNQKYRVINDQLSSLEEVLQVTEQLLALEK